MAAPIPSSKANLDPIFAARYGELQTNAQNEFTARQQGNQVVWNRPASWDGDEFDFVNMGLPFERTQANQDGVAAFQDPTNPGVTGDIVATTTMIECLASMERAFRNRHTMRRCRAVCHSLTRRKGHGDPTGALGQNAVNYATEILKAAKAASL